MIGDRSRHESRRTPQSFSHFALLIYRIRHCVGIIGAKTCPRSSLAQGEILDLTPTIPYLIARNVDAVRQYHVPSTSAGEASVRSPSSLTCSSLNARPASTTNVCPSSLVK